MIRYRRPDEYADSLYARADARRSAQVNLLNFNLDRLPHTPSFLYLWAP